MQNAVIVGLATTLLTELSKRSKHPLFAFVDPAKPEQVKFVAGGLSLVLMVVRGLQNGSLNHGNIFVALNGLVASWLMAWAISHFAYKATPYLKATPKSE